MSLKYCIRFLQTLSVTRKTTDTSQVMVNLKSYVSKTIKGIALSGNTLRVSYHLCIRHTLDTVFELHQSSENTIRYFHIIKKQKTYRPS